MTEKTVRERELSKLKKAELIDRLLDLESRDAGPAQGDSDLPIRQLIDASPSAALVSDGERILAVNDAALRLYHADSFADFANVLVNDLIQPQFRDSSMERRKRAINDRTPATSMEIPSLALDGAEMIVEASVAPIHWRGKPAILCFQNDVTDRTNRKIVDRRLATMFETSVDAIIGSTRDAIITDWNPAAEILYGYTADEIIGQSVSIIVPPELWTEGKKFTLERAEADNREPIEVVRRRKDGTLIDVSLSISPIRDSNGDVVALSTVNRDITEARMAREALVRSEELLRVVTDNSPHVVYLKDKNFRFLKVNRAFEKLYGVREADVIGRLGPPCLDQNIVDELIRQDKKVLASGQPHESEFEFTDPDGELHHIHSVKFPVFDNNGDVYGSGGFTTDITRHKLAERALAQSEARLNAFFDHAPVGLALFDKDFRYVKVNSALAETNDLGIDEHIGRRPGDVIDWSLAADAEDVGGYDLDAPQAFSNMDVSGETKNMPGIRRHWIVSRFPIPGEDESAGSHGSVVVEITDRKQAEEALRASEQRLRDIAETGTDWIWEMNADLEFTWISDSGRNALGMPNEFYVGKSIEEIGAPDDNTYEWRQHLKKLKAHEPFRDFPRLRIFPDGLPHHILTSGNPVFTPDGAFAGYRGTGRDITAEVEAKEQSALAQERFMRAIDTSSEGLVLFDADERVVLANRTFLENAIMPTEWWAPGAKYEDILEKIIANGVFSDHYGDQPEGWANSILTRFREKGEPFEFRQSNGKWRRVHYEGLQDGGTIARYLDITESRQREETLRQAQKMEAVGQLTGGVAHEFNNLLMVIVGNLEMSMDSALDDKTQKFLATAMKGAMRGSDLTGQLLAFSRKQELSLEKVDLNGLVMSMREMLQRTLGETVSVETDLADNPWPVNVDAGQVEGALLNLSLNACDAMPRGGRIVIRSSNHTLSAREVGAHSDVLPGDFVLLEVSDNGAGIAPDVLERVFEPFFTTKDIGEGTGLGLSMVHGFVEQSGGFVKIDSMLDHGTKVQIYLPRAANVAGSDAIDHSADAVANSSGTTVLVVEDDPDVRDLVVLLLTELGCNIVEAEDGAAALRLIEARDDINLLFTDVVLPRGMSGPDVAQAAAARRPGLKIVFTSGYPDREIDQFEWNDENRRIIRKPYRKADLAEMLSDVIGV